MKNHGRVAYKIMEAMVPVKADDGDVEALAIYLAGCVVSLLQEPTAAREAEIRGRLRGLVGSPKDRSEPKVRP